MLISNHQKGLAAGLFCFIFWGFAPIYFKFIQDVPAIVIIAHRVTWGSLFLFVFLALRERRAFFKAMRISVRQLGGLFISGMLVASNWLIFVWAVTHDQILATSLGYFINPLVNILLGTLFLHERMNRAQTGAVVIASAATLFLAFYIGQPPWIALFLAVTFGLYGLAKKQLNVKPLIGLMWETILLMIPAVIYLLLFAPQLTPTEGNNNQFWLLFFAGLVTVLPLIGFNYAAKKLSLIFIGFLQYIAPSISFIIAVLFYGETFTLGHQIAFAGIWIALLIVSWSPIHKLIRSKQSRHTS
ncbi:MAG: EamA family transporter RarD [Alcanivoracaceae bacterium]|nr:EamA family transporter RarD [Alcanivoracaceae bacterium]